MAKDGYMTAPKVIWDGVGKKVLTQEWAKGAPLSDPASLELRQRIDLATHYGLFRPGQVFTDGLRDGSRGPVLVVVPHGAFRMGAPEGEHDATAAERPQHVVRLERGFAMSRNEVSVGEFGRFVVATGYQPRATQRGHSMAYDVRSGNFVRGSGIDWRSGHDGRPAAADMPVIHVSARDAEAYTAWLSEQAGAHYRLPSEAEFEYALRAGSSTRFPWGEGRPPARLMMPVDVVALRPSITRLPSSAVMDPAGLELVLSVTTSAPPCRLASPAAIRILPPADCADAPL